MSNPTTPFGWQMPQSTDLVTNLPADFEVFGQAVATDLQYLLGGTTGQVLAKASGTDLDFDWVTDASGMTNPMTTTADVIYSSSGSTPARLGIGTAGQVLTVNAGATAPEWVAPAGGSISLLSTTNLSGAEVTISSISQSYQDLLIIIDNWTITTAGKLAVGLNGSYSLLPINSNYSSTQVGLDDGKLWDSGITTKASAMLYITQYTNTSIRKPVFGSIAKGATFEIGGVLGGFFNSTSALSSIKIKDDYGNYTMTAGTCRIYGVN